MKAQISSGVQYRVNVVLRLTDGQNTKNGIGVCYGDIRCYPYNMLSCSPKLDVGLAGQQLLLFVDAAMLSSLAFVQLQEKAICT